MKIKHVLIFKPMLNLKDDINKHYNFFFQFAHSLKLVSIDIFAETDFN